MVVLMRLEGYGQLVTSHVILCFSLFNTPVFLRLTTKIRAVNIFEFLSRTINSLTWSKVLMFGYKLYTTT